MTIKYNIDQLGNIKVVTKAGRVSCECCEGEGECCLYPGQAVWEGKYSIEDLPNFYNADGTIYTKLPSFEIGLDGSKYCYDIPDTSLRFGIDPPAGIRASEWQVEGAGAGLECFSFTWFQGTPGAAQYIGDLFASTYAIEGPISGDEGRISGNVTRQSACTWVGDGLILRHNSRIKFVLGGPNEILGSFKWSVNGNLKLGFQNTPVGSYAGEFTVS